MSETTTKYTSPKIASEMEKLFGNSAKDVNVAMKFRREVGQFILKVDRAHDQAKKSKQTFK